MAHLYEILRNLHDGILLFDRILIDRKRGANPKQLVKRTKNDLELPG